MVLFDSFSSLHAKIPTIKAFHEESLVSLTLEGAPCFKNFEKRQAVLNVLVCLAAAKLYVQTAKS